MYALLFCSSLLEFGVSPLVLFPFFPYELLASGSYSPKPDDANDSKYLLFPIAASPRRRLTPRCAIPRLRSPCLYACFPPVTSFFDFLSEPSRFVRNNILSVGSLPSSLPDPFVPTLSSPDVFEDLTESPPFHSPIVNPNRPSDPINDLRTQRLSFRRTGGYGPLSVCRCFCLLLGFFISCLTILLHFLPLAHKVEIWSLGCDGVFP